MHCVASSVDENASIEQDGNWLSLLNYLLAYYQFVLINARGMKQFYFLYFMHTCENAAGFIG